MHIVDGQLGIRSITRSGRRIDRVFVADVLYFKSELKYINVVTAAKTYLMEGSLIHLEKQLGDAFIRIHRNCLVRRAAISGLIRELVEEGEDGYYVVGLHGMPARLIVSRRHESHVIGAVST